MNVITGEKDIPQGVLIRAGEGYNVPAKLTKRLMINKEQNGTYIYDNDSVWIEDDGYKPVIETAKRVGIDYAGEYWRDIEWRFIDGSKEVKK
jgi:DNA-3-methyladenine glycosylase